MAAHPTGDSQADRREAPFLLALQTPLRPACGRDDARSSLCGHQWVEATRGGIDSPSASSIPFCRTDSMVTAAGGSIRTCTMVATDTLVPSLRARFLASIAERPWLASGRSYSAVAADRIPIKRAAKSTLIWRRRGSIAAAAATTTRGSEEARAANEGSSRALAPTTRFSASGEHCPRYMRMKRHGASAACVGNCEVIWDLGFPVLLSLNVS